MSRVFCAYSLCIALMFCAAAVMYIYIFSSGLPLPTLKEERVHGIEAHQSASHGHVLVAEYPFILLQGLNTSILHGNQFESSLNWRILSLAPERENYRDIFNYHEAGR